MKAHIIIPCALVFLAHSIFRASRRLLSILIWGIIFYPATTIYRKYYMQKSRSLWFEKVQKKMLYFLEGRDKPTELGHKFFGKLFDIPLHLKYEEYFLSFLFFGCIVAMYLFLSQF